MEFIKYKNRKLYSKQLKRYVNLTELVPLIENNVNFKVMTYNTKEDVTNSILKQLVLVNDNITNNQLITLLKQ